MERLARDETRKPDVELGIYRTHPPSPDRARSLLAQLEFMEIAVNRHTTDPYLSAKVATITVNGIKMAEVAFVQKSIAKMAASGGATAEVRAERFANALNDLMDKNLQIYEVKLNGDKSGILARNQLLAAFTSADSEPQGISVEKLAQNAVDAVRNLIWQTQFDRIPATSSR
jgi:hypothetical protein